MRLLPIATAALLTLSAFAARETSAQQLPAFSFQNSGRVSGVGGIGIRAAGRQAILADRLLGSRPKNFARISPGAFAPVSRGRGGIPVVRGSDSVYLTNGRPGWSTGASGGGAGVFNTFFLPRSYGVVYSAAWAPPSDTALYGWVNMVAAFDGYPADLFYSGQAIDQWAAQVFTLDDQG